MHGAVWGDYLVFVFGLVIVEVERLLHFEAKAPAYEWVLEIQLKAKKMTYLEMTVMSDVAGIVTMSLMVVRHPFAGVINDAAVGGDVSLGIDWLSLPRRLEPLAHSPKPWCVHHSFRP